MNNTHQTIAIGNAGLVLLHGYFPMLFQRLGLVESNQFISEEDQFKGVHCLQYLAIGTTNTEETYLFLNKILCGVDVSTPIDIEITITEADKELMNGLLDAAIGHWTAIGGSSIDGFRGNWLVREGSLNEESNHWELIVEKKSYDILIQRSPFSFSEIKFPWMEKPLEVNWPY